MCGYSIWILRLVVIQMRLGVDVRWDGVSYNQLI